MIKTLAKRVLNAAGLKTDRKMFILCSDDWGGLRVKSAEVRLELLKAGIDLNDNRFDRFDTLESNRDVEALFDVLLKYRDTNGRNPVITAVMNVANPDFKKIADNGFTHYYYESVIDTLKRYPGRDKVFNYYNDGRRAGIWCPEFHGREHLQVAWWMHYLRENNKFVREAFAQEYFALDGKYLNNRKHAGIGAAFDLENSSDLEMQKEIIKDGLQIFERIFGQSSRYFTAPVLHYSSALEATLSESGIDWIDVARIRRMPTTEGGRSLKLHYLGQRNKHNQRFLVRNAVFETNMSDSDGVDVCLAGIEEAFKFRQPAIISNHRASFVSGLSEENGERGIRALDRLLSTALRRWPDLEFATVQDLNFV